MAQIVSLTLMVIAALGLIWLYGFNRSLPDFSPPKTTISDP